MYKIVALFFAHDFFLALSPMFAMFSAFMLDEGLSPMMIAVCFTTYFIATSLFELPSSLIADKFSRKKVVLVADVVAFIGTAVMLVSQSQFAFIACLVISAIAYALKSGTMEALLYDELKVKNLEDKFPKAFAIYQSAFLIGLAFGLMIASYTIMHGYGFVTFIAMVSICISLLLLFFFINETPRFKIVGKEYSFTQIFQEAKNTILKSNVMLFMCLIVAIYQSVVMAFGDIAIVTSMHLGWQKEEIARVCSILTFMNIGVMFFVAKHISKLTVRVVNGILFVVLLFPFVGMMFGQWWSIFFVFPVWWCAGISDIAVRTRIQGLVQSSSRATVTSVISLVMGVFYIVSTLAIGYIATKASYSAGIVVIAGVMCFIMGLIFYRSRKDFDGVK
jgi:MFS family permease